ncbi:hypothetical protein GF362_07015 [Candidatus Dojkabacteria bacterium]|nr:hypothetical protein [Candidatus Dojkabacteria bacterium]
MIVEENNIYDSKRERNWGRILLGSTIVLTGLLFSEEIINALEATEDTVESNPSIPNDEDPSIPPPNQQPPLTPPADNQPATITIDSLDIPENYRYDPESMIVIETGDTLYKYYGSYINTLLQEQLLYFNPLDEDPGNWEIFGDDSEEIPENIQPGDAFININVETDEEPSDIEPSPQETEYQVITDYLNLDHSEIWWNNYEVYLHNRVPDEASNLFDEATDDNFEIQYIVLHLTGSDTISAETYAQAFNNNETTCGTGSNVFACANNSVNVVIDKDGTQYVLYEPGIPNINVDLHDVQIGNGPYAYSFECVGNIVDEDGNWILDEGNQTTLTNEQAESVAQRIITLIEEGYADPNNLWVFRHDQVPETTRIEPGRDFGDQIQRILAENGYQNIRFSYPTE